MNYELRTACPVARSRATFDVHVPHPDGIFCFSRLRPTNNPWVKEMKHRFLNFFAFATVTFLIAANPAPGNENPVKPTHHSNSIRA